MRRIVLVFSLMLLVSGGGLSAGVRAQTRPSDAQQQVATAVQQLLDSEAANAAGAYVPGVGAVFTLELVRGPNTLPGISAADGTANWVIYLMQTFGAQLTAVPASEVIAFSVSFYNFDENLFHLLVVSSRANAIADATQYLITLDGDPYSVGGAGSATTVPSSPTPATGVTPQGSPIAGASKTTLGFDNPANALDWTPVAGTWSVADGTYKQAELGLYDLVSYYNRPVTGNVQIRVQMRYLGGQMGGGLVFNAPDPGTKNLAQMVSFAGGGTFLQWGSYDSDGVFQYQGGVDVEPSAADGEWHSLAIQTVGTTYTIFLDGKEVARDIPLIAPSGGYLGLLASTSSVAFDNLEIVSTAP